MTLQDSHPGPGGNERAQRPGVPSSQESSSHSQEAEDAKDSHGDPFREHQLPGCWGAAKPSEVVPGEGWGRREGPVVGWGHTELSGCSSQACQHWGAPCAKAATFIPRPFLLFPLMGQGQQHAVPQDSHGQASCPQGDRLPLLPNTENFQVPKLRESTVLTFREYFYYL